MSSVWLASVTSGVAVMLVGRRFLVGARPSPARRPGPARPGSVGSSGLTVTSGTATRLGGPAIVALALLIGAWLLGPAPTAAMAGGGVLLRARLKATAERHRGDRVARAVPELIDLFQVAAAAGHPAARCVDLVIARAPEGCRPALAGAARRSAAGASLAASLEPVGPALGPLGPALVEVVLGAHRTGGSLAAGCSQLAATARDQRRREAEARARRLPVTMLFPLVCCVLPAFGLLAVVPLLAASLGSLQP